VDFSWSVILIIGDSWKCLLDIGTLNKYDAKKMYAIYDKWPEIAKNAYNSNVNPVDFKNIEHIVFAGMGGSGALGDIFSSILSKTNVHVTLVKGYLLPKTVDSNTLVVPTSVSGNTVETSTVIESARKLGCKIIAFSAGGKIENYCIKIRFPANKMYFCLLHFIFLNAILNL